MEQIICFSFSGAMKRVEGLETSQLVSDLTLHNLQLNQVSDLPLHNLQLT